MPTGTVSVEVKRTSASCYPLLNTNRHRSSQLASLIGFRKMYLKIETIDGIDIPSPIFIHNTVVEAELIAARLRYSYS